MADFADAWGQSCANPTVDSDPTKEPSRKSAFSCALVDTLSLRKVGFKAGLVLVREQFSVWQQSSGYRRKALLGLRTDCGNEPGCPEKVARRHPPWRILPTPGAKAVQIQRSTAIPQRSHPGNALSSPVRVNVLLRGYDTAMKI